MSERYWLIHGLARCESCGWETDGKNAMGLAAQHHKKTGHLVSGELGYAFSFPGKKRGGSD